MTPLWRPLISPAVWQIFALTVLISSLNVRGGEPSYVDSKAIQERFDQITPADLELLRGKKILFASRSFGLNMFKGLRALAKTDKSYDIVSSYELFNVFKQGGDLGIIPADAFQKTNVVHVLIAAYPPSKRLTEIDQLLNEAPHEFGKTVDFIFTDYSTIGPEDAEPYLQAMAGWQTKFPNAKVIYTTGGMKGPKHAEKNEESHAFGEKIRAAVKGKAPLYDMEAILSDDWKNGNLVVPEYSRDPSEVHPSAPAGEEALAKGFLLVLSEALTSNPGTEVTPSPQTAGTPSMTTTLPANHPEAKAVRAILDANNLKAKTVEGVSVVENGHIVELFLQETGITNLTEEIGVLTALRKLHIYGDRDLGELLLQTISPAIGQCTAITELLLNQNELTTLPAEIARLQNLRLLSIADNHLTNLPPTVTVWAEKFDPKGLKDQKPAGN